MHILVSNGAEYKIEGAIMCFFFSFFSCFEESSRQWVKDRTHKKQGKRERERRLNTSERLLYV